MWICLAIIMLLVSTVTSSSWGVSNSVGSLGYRPSPISMTQQRSSLSTGRRRSSSRVKGGDMMSSNDLYHVDQCSLSNDIGKNILRGAFLRIASDITIGTPLESVKCRVTVTTENMFESYHNIVKESGFGALWAGSGARTAEGALMGALFMIGSVVTKRRVLAMGGSPFIASLTAGTIGGIAQTIVMTPAGMVFTSLNVNRGKKGYENDTSLTVARRIIREKGIGGMYFGAGPLALRQATNWATRSGLTEVARTTFRMSQYGLIGEIGSGIIGGIGSCWNTPVETIRVIMQRDVSMGRTSKPFGTYWRDIVEEDGYVGLFRGVTPRGIQAIWQTVFLVVVPNMMGI